MEPGNSAVTTVVTAIPFLAFLISFAVAAFVAGQNLVADKFTNSFFLIYSCAAFYYYCSIYGVIGMFLLWISPYLLQRRLLEINIANCNAVYFLAVLIGLFTKPFMHMRVLEIDGKPFGPEAVEKILDSGLIRAIRNHHQHRLWSFLQPYIDKYNDVACVQNKIISRIPDNYSLDETEAIKIDIERADTIEILFQRCLKQFGSQNLKQIFPLD